MCCSGSWPGGVSAWGALSAEAGATGVAGSDVRLPGRGWPAELSDAGALSAENAAASHGSVPGDERSWHCGWGSPGLGHVALDGTKLKANTSKHKAMSYGRMRQGEDQLKEEIAHLVEQAEAQDTAEDQEYGADSDGYSVAEELARREARLAKIRAAREHLRRSSVPSKGFLRASRR